MGSSKGQHFIRHVDANDSSRWPDSTRGFEAINPTTRSNIQDGFPRLDRGQPHGRPTAIGHLQDRFRDECAQVLMVIACRTTHFFTIGHCPGIPFTYSSGNHIGFHKYSYSIIRDILIILI